MSYIKTALLAVVSAVGVYATLCYTLGVPGQPTITLTVERIEPIVAEVFDLPPLLDLVAVEPEFDLSLLPVGPEALLGLRDCFEYGMLHSEDRTVFMLDFARDRGIDTFDPCVKRHGERASNKALEMCDTEDSLKAAFRLGVNYLWATCDPGMPKWDLEPATSHTEFLEEWL